VRALESNAQEWVGSRRSTGAAAFYAEVVTIQLGGQVTGVRQQRHGAIRAARDAV
jgi:hypothetical protein